MKALKYVGGAVAVIIVGLGIFLATFDVSQYKGLIQDQAKAATGREVTIGDIKLAVSLSPAIVLTDVSIANAPWGSRPAMATIKRFEAATQLVPLLFGTVNISGLKIVEGDVLLEVNAAGKANWEFETASPASTAPPPPLNVDGIAIDGLKLAYRDAKQGMSADVALGDAAIRMAGDLLKLEVTKLDLSELALKFKDKTQSADVTVGKLALNSAGPITALGIRAVDAGSVALTRTAGGATTAAKFATFRLDADGALTLDGELDGQAIKAAGTLAPIADLVGLKKPIPAKLAVTAFGMSADTDIVVDLSKKIPAAKGSLSIPSLDLATMMPNAPAPKAANAPAPGGKLFPADPLPWDLLGAADADLNLSVGTLKLPNGLELTAIKVPVKLSGGALTANGLAASLIGGTVTADLGLVLASKSVSAKVAAQGFTAEKLLTQFGVSDMIGKGDLDLAADVRGSGDSVRAVMAGLNGSLIGGMGESRIRNESLNFVGADVLMQVVNAINPFANKDPYTVAKCTVVNFQIANGIANTDKGIAFVTDKMEVVSTGKIDLAQETLDLAIRPKATGGISVGLGNLTQSFKLSGPLSKPGLAIDGKGAVKALGTLGAAFATGGISVLAQSAKEKVDTATGGDPCAEARTWHTKKS